MPITRIFAFAFAFGLVAVLLTGCGGDEPAPDAGLLADGGPRPVRDMRVDQPLDSGQPDVLTPDAGSHDGEVRDGAPPDAGVACGNGRDDDGDGRVDLEDPGCDESTDDDEIDPLQPPACSNELDDDDDGLIDFPADPDCTAAGGGDEGAVCGPLSVTPLEVAGTSAVRLRPRPGATGARCGEGAGEAAVGTIAIDGPAIVRVSAAAPGPVRVFARTRCRDRLSEVDCRAPDDGPLEVEIEGEVTLYVFVQPAPGFELVAAVDVAVTVEVVPVADTCRNGLDDDGDGLSDQADPGCSGASDADETDPVPLPECGNGIDDDGDGAIDWPDDPECTAAGALREGLACGGIEAAALGVGRHELAFRFDSTVPGETRGQCGGNGDEAVAVLAVDRPASFLARVTTAEAGTMATYLRRDCRDRFTEAVCDAAFSDRQIVVDRLEAGTWFLFFDHDVSFARRVDEVEATVTLTALARRACEDGVDNDGDGRVDAADPGCARAGHDDEVDPIPGAACANGIDDDGNGATDWPDDVACVMAGSGAEGSGCIGDAPVVPVGDAGGRFVVDARPLASNTAIASCGGDLGAETVFALTLTRPADVQVALADVGRFGRSRVFMRSRCDDPASEHDCTTDGALALDALAPGTWFFFVELGEAQQPGPPPTVRFDVRSLIGPCNDGIDNDGDGRVDLADPGCISGRHGSEDDPPEPPQCANDIDDDGDGAVDWPADRECRAAGGVDEAPVCAPDVLVVPMASPGGRVEVPFGGRGVEPICGEVGESAEVVVALAVDEPSRITVELVDGAVRYGLREVCSDAATEFFCAPRLNFERRDYVPGTSYLLLSATEPGTTIDIRFDSLVRSCNDGVDNDVDGRIDLADPGCSDGGDDSEADPEVPPMCADGIDNDGDGAVDWPDDPECLAAGGADEERLCLALGEEQRVPAAGGAFEVDTTDLPNVLRGTCGGGDAGESALTLRLDAPARVVAEVIEARHDTLMYIVAGCEAGDFEAECDDDGGDGNFARIDTRLDAGRWVIVVDGFGDDSGPSTVRVDVIPEAMP